MHKYIIGKIAQKHLKKIAEMGFDHISILWSNYGSIQINAEGYYIHTEKIEFEDKRDKIHAHSWYSVDDATRQLMVLAKKCKEK